MQIDKLYSYGIGKDISFEINFQKYWPIQTYLYDHTIDKLPMHKEEHLFSWKKEGVGPVATNELNTLANHIKENNDTNNNNLMLKMDVEGAEWFSLNAASDETLRQFKQIVLEFHFLTKPNKFASQETKLNVLRRLKNLFHIVHVHGNNFAEYYEDEDYLIPSVLEVTYLRKDHNIEISTTKYYYPIEGLDYANNWLKYDILLHKKPFAPST